MKKSLATLFLIVSLLAGMACGPRNTVVTAPMPPVTPPPATATASFLPGENLNPNAVLALFRDAQNAQDLEARLNSPGSINNVDLDNDGNVDYVRVTEFGSTPNQRNLSLSAILGSGQEQELGTITVANNNGSYGAQFVGNQALYGPTHVYHSTFGVGDALFLAWLFSPSRTVYVSPYRYGYYPPTYRVYRPVVIDTYRTTSRTYVVNKKVEVRQVATPVIRTNTVSPNATKVVRDLPSLRTNTTTQKQVQVQPSNTSIGKGGAFGRDTAKPVVTTPPKPATINQAPPKPSYNPPKPPPARTPTRSFGKR